MEVRALRQGSVPPGYKQTDFGEFPADWSESTVGEEFEVQLGKMVDAARNQGVAKPYLGNAAVKWGAIDVSEIQMIPLSQAELGRFRLRRGDLLVCEGRGVGRSAVWEDQLPECYYQKALHRLRSRRGFDPRLMSALFRYWVDQRLLSNYVTESTIPHLTKEKLVLIPLAVPPCHEQRAITTALNDVDALLDGLTRLIAKKRDLKQAAMQQLLTGQTRLPGFHEEWEVKRLGDHVTFLRNGVNSRAELTLDAPVKYLHYGDVHACTGVLLAPDALLSIPSVKATRLDRLRNGDLILADASEDLAGVSKSVEMCRVGSTPVVAGLHTIAVRSEKNILADGFKAYLQFIPAFAGQLRRLAAGTKVYATNRAHIASIEMSLPGADEQTAIASVLNDMNAEIEALEGRRDKTRALKQAMMQELLTGKTRLAEPASANEAAC
jgi:type I restriction enzyme, S subunit